MLKSLDLTYFRRHESLHIDFTLGLNAVRGPNEAGKSTILEAVMYALGGAKTLRDTLAETVTWGHKERELKVQLVLTSGGHDHVFKRGKSGAECHYVDGAGVQQVITGQDEVTAKATDLLGCDLKMAANLMLSSQAGLRGALEDGPTAVSSMMAKLADIDVIDRILAVAGQRLATGADAPLRAKLEESQADLEQAVANPPADPRPGLQAQVDQANNERAFMLKRVEEELTPAVASAEAALSQGRDRAQAHVRAANTLRAADDAVARIAIELAQARGRAADRPSADELASATAAAEAEINHAATLQLYRRVTSLKYPEAYWDEPLESLHAAIEACEALTATAQQIKVSHQTKIAEAQASITAHEATIKTILAGKITNGKCPTCGSAKASDEHVLQHNSMVEASTALTREKLAAQQSVLSQLQAALGPISASVVEAQGEVSELRNLLKTGKPFDDLAASVEGNALVKVDRSVYPPRTTWVGEPPVATGNAAQQALAALQGRVRAADQAAGQATVHEKALQAAQQALANAKIDAEACPPVDVAPLEAAHRAAWNALAEVNGLAMDKGTHIERLQREIVAAEFTLKHHAEHIVLLQKRIGELQTDLKTLARNNAFITKLKSMKPKVTDRLWNRVLTAASSFFTQMRGETSVIERTGGEFLVNGRGIKGLSGSTLDVLALSVRVAMTRTFLPHVPLISLDEPAHGCDDDRTGNLLSFLAGCGFSQVLLASHDGMSEAVADNVIALS